MSVIKAYRNSQGQMIAPPFRDATRRKSIRLGFPQISGFGSTQRADLPRTGLLAGIRVRYNATLAVATPGGSFPTYPWSPANLFKSIRLSTSAGVSLWQTSGIGAYLHNGYSGLNSWNDVNPVGAHNSTLWAAVNTPFSGTVQTTQTANGFFYVYPAVSALDLRGLHLLQTDQVTSTLELTTADTADIMGAATGTPTLTVTVNAGLDVFELPDPPESRPNFETSWERVVNEFNGTTPIVGDTTTPIQIGGPIYNRLQGLLINNGAPAAATDIQKLQLGYAGRTTTLYDEDYYDHALAIEREYGFVPPTGSFCYAWSETGAGQPGVYSERDLIDTRGLADLSHTITINSGVSLTTPRIIYIQDYMLPRQPLG